MGGRMSIRARKKDHIGLWSLPLAAGKGAERSQNKLTLRYARHQQREVF